MFKMDEFDIEKQTEPPADYVSWSLNNFKVEDVSDSPVLCNLEPWDSISCGATAELQPDLSKEEIDIKMDPQLVMPEKIDPEAIVSEDQLSTVDLGHICEIVGQKNDPDQVKQYLCLYCGMQLSWNHLCFHMKFGHNNHDKVKLCKRFDCEYHSKIKAENEIVDTTVATAPPVAPIVKMPETKETNGVEVPETKKCTMCDFQTTKKASLREHMKYTHPKEEEVEMHKCLICGFQTKYKYGLKKHAKKHGGELTLHKCPCCEYQTIMPLLLEHIKFKHSEEQAGPPLQQ